MLIVRGAAKAPGRPILPKTSCRNFFATLKVWVEGGRSGHPSLCSRTSANSDCRAYILSPSPGLRPLLLASPPHPPPPLPAPDYITSLFFPTVSVCKLAGHVTPCVAARPLPHKRNNLSRLSNHLKKHLKNTLGVNDLYQHVRRYIGSGGMRHLQSLGQRCP